MTRILHDDNDETASFFGHLLRVGSSTDSENCFTVTVATVTVSSSFFREAVLMLELPKLHATSLNGQTLTSHHSSSQSPQEAAVSLAKLDKGAHAGACGHASSGSDCDAGQLQPAWCP